MPNTAVTSAAGNGADPPKTICPLANTALIRHCKRGSKGATLTIDEPPGEAWCMPCAVNVPLACIGEPCPRCGLLWCAMTLPHLQVALVLALAPILLTRLRLLYEANPVGFVMEQAGGRASTGRQNVLAVRPTALHQRIGLVFGSKNEVERIERYHHEPAPQDDRVPLFATRSLFRD